MLAAFDPRYKLSPGEIVDRSQFVGAWPYTSVAVFLVVWMHLDLILVSIQALVCNFSRQERQHGFFFIFSIGVYVLESNTKRLTMLFLYFFQICKHW